jgi:pimeloyl-ACP methyl ester carboxylesterase
MGGRVAMLMALKYPAKVKKLIVASVGPGAPGAPPIPFKMCKEMAEWGYEKYVREHTLEVGWTREYIQQHPDKVEHFLNIRLNNLPRLEDYLRHVVARQACDLSARIREIQHPTLVLVGEHDSRLCDRRVAPRCRRGASEGVTQWKVCRGTKRSAQLFHDQPG